MKKRVQIPVVTLLLLLSATAFAAVEGSFDRTMKVSGRVDLDVTSGSGNIYVHQGDSGSVIVKGHIRVNEGLMSWFSGRTSAISR